mmetsp:Transcript_43297/g.133746  ORF Transcript_43297/g.133746 Transcript_43297/m.133746 type:complete len:232 (+) Transcript_43297:247-942(+)
MSPPVRRSASMAASRGNPISFVRRLRLACQSLGTSPPGGGGCDGGGGGGALPACDGPRGREAGGGGRFAGGRDDGTGTLAVGGCDGLAGAAFAGGGEDPPAAGTVPSMIILAARLSLPLAARNARAARPGSHPSSAASWCTRSRTVRACSSASASFFSCASDTSGSSPVPDASRHELRTARLDCCTITSVMCFRCESLRPISVIFASFRPYNFSRLSTPASMSFFTASGAT